MIKHFIFPNEYKKCAFSLSGHDIGNYLMCITLDAPGSPVRHFYAISYAPSYLERPLIVLPAAVSHAFNFQGFI